MHVQVQCGGWSGVVQWVTPSRLRITNGGALVSEGWHGKTPGQRIGSHYFPEVVISGGSGGVESGAVDEFLGAAVEGPALEQLEVEVGRAFEDRLHSRLPGDYREDRHLDAVDQTGGH